MKQRIHPLLLVPGVLAGIALGFGILMVTVFASSSSDSGATRARMQESVNTTWSQYVAGDGVVYENEVGGFAVVVPVEPTVNETTSADGLGRIQTATASVGFGEFADVMHRDFGPGFMGGDPDVAYDRLPEFCAAVYESVSGTLLEDGSGWAGGLPHYDFTFRFEGRGMELVSSNRAIVRGQSMIILTVISADAQPEAFTRLVDSFEITA